MKTRLTGNFIAKCRGESSDRLMRKAGQESQLYRGFEEAHRSLNKIQIIKKVEYCAD